MTGPAGTSVESRKLSVGDMAVPSRREAVDTDRAVSAQLDDSVRATLQGEADSRHQAMAGKDLACALTTPSRHFVGVLGEAGVLVWLRGTLPSSSRTRTIQRLYAAQGDASKGDSSVA